MEEAVSDPQLNLLNSGCSQYNVTNFKAFSINLNASFIQLREQLNSNQYFATAQQARGSDPAYAMVQCRNYLSSADCLACFETALTRIRNCSTNGARVIYDGCFLRYESNNFYEQSTQKGHSMICGISQLLTQMISKQQWKGYSQTFKLPHQGLTVTMLQLRRRWAAPGMLNRAWTLYENNMHIELVDESLESNEYEAEDMKRIIEIALMCAQSTPALRPTMSEVVVLLKSKGSIERRPLTKPTFIESDYKRVRIPNVDLKSEFEYIFTRIDAKEAVDGRESKQEDGQTERKANNNLHISGHAQKEGNIYVLSVGHKCCDPFEVLRTSKNGKKYYPFEVLKTSKKGNKYWKSLEARSDFTKDGIDYSVSFVFESGKKILIFLDDRSARCFPTKQILYICDAELNDWDHKEPLYTKTSGFDEGDAPNRPKEAWRSQQRRGRQPGRRHSRGDETDNFRGRKEWRRAQPYREMGGNKGVSGLDPSMSSQSLQDFGEP
ncbi:hypothetical protein COLO4_24823 [Corchorus olitorius]|uniref:Gnk2-homologous domain-containing protein n=1 Tax=Corchorus olitorius TaxID=93759 RepID=A0A1R3I6B3_9ROSI|nr:hypothetical protein COLO4_24823 [Corchorus olitorius]